jgi:hypothetical protein
MTTSARPRRNPGTTVAAVAESSAKRRWATFLASVTVGVCG